MKQIYKVIFGMVAFFGAERIHAMEHKVEHVIAPQIREFVEITFNNYPDDTVIRLNDGRVEITPTRKNIKVNGVKNVEVKNLEGFLLRLWLIHELQTTKTITVVKNAETGEYAITVL